MTKVWDYDQNLVIFVAVQGDLRAVPAETADEGRGGGHHQRAHRCKSSRWTAYPPRAVRLYQIDEAGEEGNGGR